MPITDVRHNGNNSERERQKKKTKTERSKGVVPAIVKVWELNGFAVRLS